MLNLCQVQFLYFRIEGIDVTAASGLGRQKVPNLCGSGEKRIHVAIYWGKGALVGKTITTLSCPSGFWL